MIKKKIKTKKSALVSGLKVRSFEKKRESEGRDQ